MHSAPRPPLRPRTLSSHDTALVALIATVLSCTWFAWYLHHDLLLAYADAITHPMIARRVLDSPTPGISQIGGVWPPLPHLLILPLIWNDWLYRTGIAASLLSMACYVIAVVAIYRIGLLLRLRPLLALVPAAIVAFNPNIRYMQSVGMTELPLIAATVVAVAFLIHWSQTESLRSFIFMMLAVIAASATRYEGWVLWGAVLVALGFIMLRRGWGRARAVDYGVYYLAFAGIFIPAWMAWNEIILGTGWLGFSTSKYASSDIWVTANEPSIGHLDIAIKTYWYAMADMCGVSTLLLGGAGLVVFLLRDRLRPETAGLLVLGFPIPFFVAALYTGQRPLHVAQISGDLYNVRFALQMLPLFALLAGILLQAALGRASHAIGRLRTFPTRTPFTRLAGFGALAIGIALLSSIANIALREPVLASTTANREDQAAIATCMGDITGPHARILMQTFDNELVLFYSHIDLGTVVYEGTYQLWDEALADPAGHVDWIYMRTTSGNEDDVWQALHANAAALAPFRIVMQTDGAVLYGRIGLVGEGSPASCALPNPTGTA